jgi:hypothetical protein
LRFGFATSITQLIATARITKYVRMYKLSRYGKTRKGWGLRLDTTRDELHDFGLMRTRRKVYRCGSICRRCAPTRDAESPPEGLRRGCAGPPAGISGAPGSSRGGSI